MRDRHSILAEKFDGRFAASEKLLAERFAASENLMVEKFAASDELLEKLAKKYDESFTASGKSLGRLEIGKNSGMPNLRQNRYIA